MKKKVEKKESMKIISESDYINIIIIHNIDENQIFTAFSLKQIVDNLNEEDLKNILFSFHYLCNSNELFYQLNGKEYLGAIIHILLFALEVEDEQLLIDKNIILKYIILLIEKLFLSKKLNDKNILLIAKFLAFTSIYERKEITQQNIGLLMELSNLQIKNYQRFIFIFDLIKKINQPKITYEFCLFLKKHIFMNKINYFMFVRKIDLLNFMYLNDEDNKILNFLGEIYAFKFNPYFLDVFMKQIKEVYDIKNKDNNSIEVLTKLNKSISLFIELKKNEETKYLMDPFFLNRAFVFNNHEKDGVYIDNISIQNSFSLITSFCFAPKKFPKSQKNSKKSKEYPIIQISENNSTDKNMLYLFIKDNNLYFRNFYTDKNIELCKVAENQTYFCFYAVKEKENYILQITHKESFIHRNKFAFPIKGRFSVILGKCNKDGFEGYIGTTIIYKKYLENLNKNFSVLKGSYDKALYYCNYNTQEIDIYDKLFNNDPDNFFEIKKLYQSNDEMSKDLLAYISPPEEVKSLNKLYYYNTSFIQNKISFYIEPKLENGATFFLENLDTIYEFLKFEGMNYILLIFELINSNVENIKTEKDKQDILNIFKSLIYFLIIIFNSISIEYYIDKIRSIIFCIKKCVLRISHRIKMAQEMIESLKDLLLFLNSQNFGELSNKNDHFIFMRNEICKFLLDINLYDLEKFKTIEYFLLSLNNSIITNCLGLTSLDIFKKIMNFTIIYKQNILPKKNEIMHSSEYKSLKHEMSHVLINYLLKCEKIVPYNDIFQLFSKGYEFDYKSYQLFKLFYLSSEYYFSNDTDKNIIFVLKYFIDLYENLNNCEYSDMNIILKKEKYITMALCLRIFLEYTIVENPPKFKDKKVRTGIIKRFFNEVKVTFDNKTTHNLVIIDSKKLDTNDINIISNNIIEDNEINTQNNNIKQIDDKNIIIKEDNNNTNTNNNNNEILLESKQKEKIYYDYFSFHTLFQSLQFSKQFNDYCFKSILLFILEKNNNVFVSQNIKYKFIVKTKGFNDLKDNDYDSFLKLSYYNDETKELFLKLLELLEKNNKHLQNISYEIMIYLIIRIAKERKNNECVFKHFISSRKICCKIFLLSFLNNKKSSQTLLREFHQMIELIIPYHKKPFIFTFLYSSIIKKELINYGKVLLNIMLVTNFNKETNPKLFFSFKLNSIILLYRILKSKEVQIDKEFNLSEQGLQEFFDIDLITSKFNIFKKISNNRKKTYNEILYEILLNLYIKTEDEKYIRIINGMFINNKEIKKSSDSKTILYFFDTLKKNIFKTNIINKILKDYEIIDNIYFTLSFFYLSLKYWAKCEDEKLKKNLLILIDFFFSDAKHFYKDNSSKVKKLKSNNSLITYLKTILEQNTGKDRTKYTNIYTLAANFKIKYYEYKNKKKEGVKDQKTGVEKFKSFFTIFNDNSNISTKSDVNENLNKIELDDSFSSCNSSKSKKAKCSNNKKKKMKFMKKKKLSELLESQEEVIINFDESEDIDIETKNSTNSKDLSYISNDSTQFGINNFSLDYIDSPYRVMIFPKLTLLEQTFGIYFTELFFYNEPFVNMKNYYKYKIKKNNGKDISIDNFFDYPIIVRNYTPVKLNFGGLFVKHDLNFFANRYFHISHPYFINKAKESKSKRIFPKLSEQNDLIDYLIDVNDTIHNTIFIVDLVTNKNVYFGELIVGKYLLYFHNLDKDKFLKNKSDEEKEKYLLCSPKCDYSLKNKKLFIFKKEIVEIINQRFLYSFQASEISLKNGKSYYFNFYSVDNKIQFFSLFQNKEANPYNIKIVSDLKSEFKKGDYTNKWLKNTISTLQYLLLLNKYSCRSYNDINQYPVFPWLRLEGNKVRDLRYPIAAQTEDKRMLLKEKYSLSSETFPYHYTTHYSNACFLIYFLIRINPYTDYQITLQVNKFDAPGRQFNSIDELLKILSSTSQPREIIPEFFMTTEFYTNYNCNFYGLKNNESLIHNLENKDGYDSPLDYVLSNVIRLESPQCKKEINFFFDNVFGVGQMGGRDKCNTYDKYSYQEKIDLNRKIMNYKAKKMSLSEIQLKIDSKSNKIISFGQTPFKLLEDIHPTWVESAKVENGNDSEENYVPISQSKVLFINITVNPKNKYIYQFIEYKNENNDTSYEIKFLYEHLNEGTLKSLKVPKKLKFFTKLRLFNKDNYLYKYNPKQVFIQYNMLLFIVCRFNNRSFCLINSKGESKYYLTESIVTCLSKVSDKSFLSGHLNGIIIEWIIQQKTPPPNTKDDNKQDEGLKEIYQLRRYIAHKERVSGIYYSDLLNVIISTGDDNKIILRKYYDLTILSMIDLAKNKFCINLKLNHCFLYTLIYDDTVKKSIIHIYSINGIKVGKIDYDYINEFCFDKIGNVLVGYYKDKVIKVYNAAMTKKLDQLIIGTVNAYNYQKIDKGNSINKEIYFNDFCYDADNNYLYIGFDNGQIIKKKYQYINDNI